MKILWLAPIPFMNDKETHPVPWIFTLIKALKNTGIDLTIVNYNLDIKEDIIRQEYNGVNLIYIKTPSKKIDVLTLYKIRIRIMNKYLKTIIGNYDLLHIHGSEHQYEVMALGLEIPTVITMQGIISEVIKTIPIFPDYKKYIIWKLSALYEKKYLPLYHNFSCRTHWDTNYIKSINKKSNIYQIWEIIREGFFKDHFSTEKRNILFVGGKNSIKGLTELLQAYNDSIQNKGLKLIILGDCDRSYIDDVVKKLNLTNIDIDNIECRGLLNQEGMIKAYEESFCLVHPTYIDNSPNSVCEAQLSGLPVIATDVGGVSSLIEDAKTGILIGRSSQEIEYAIEKILDDDILRETISNESKQMARKRHNSEYILKSTLKMYSEIIKENK